MENALNFIQIIIAILFVGAVLVQNQGSGLGAAFGGESSVYRTKRGAEKTVFNFTIVMAVLNRPHKPIILNLLCE
jgi:preprotein translocase subunit SecG